MPQFDSESDKVAQGKHAEKLRFERSLQDATGLTKLQVRQRLAAVNQFAARQETNRQALVEEKKGFASRTEVKEEVQRLEVKPFTVGGNEVGTDSTGVGAGTPIEVSVIAAGVAATMRILRV